LIALRFNVVTR